MIKKVFWGRIKYSGRLEDISSVICRDFELGKLVSNKLVLSGYEDFNFILGTNKGKYFVKIFANFRSLKDCRRYIRILEIIKKTNVSFPDLIKSKQGYLHNMKIDKTTILLCVMKYIDGNTFYRLNTLPDKKEVKFLAQQAALINSIRIKPPFIYDSWAITSFVKQWKKDGKYLSPEDFQLVAPLVKEFMNMQIKKLPHTFVHGDILTTNVIKDKNNKLWIVDFAVANYYPRIQELAVMACNILFDKKNKETSNNNLKLALYEYEKKIHLTKREKQVLPTYIKLAHAMHVLRANYFNIVEKNNSKENNYFLDQGRSGLKQMKE